MQEIKFSIIVPVYNAERYIEECILSVLAQTYKNFELILVNDGSTDSSGIIIDLYANKDQRIKVYHKKNEGQIVTRNFAISKANGDFFVFLDSDDTLEKDALSIIKDKINLYNCDLLIFDYNRIINGKKERPLLKNSNDIIITNKRDLCKLIFFDEKYNSLCIKAVSKKIISIEDYYKFSSIRRGEDLLQTLDIIKRVNKTVVIPKALYNYRQNLNSVTNTINYNNFYVDFTVRENVLLFIKESKVFNEKDLLEYRNFCITQLVKEICLKRSQICSFRLW